MRWTNREIAEDLISDIFKSVSRQLRNPNVTVEIPEIFTKSGEVKKVMTQADLESLRNVPFKQRLYYTYPDTGEKIPYSEYQRRRQALQRAERRARKSLGKTISIDTAILDNFLDPSNWNHYTPNMGEKISNWLNNIRSKYNNDLRKIVRGLELAADAGVLKEVQVFSYEHNVDTKYLPKLMIFMESAGVEMDEEDKEEAERISDEFDDISATEGIPEELLRQTQEEEEYEEQFD